MRSGEAAGEVIISTDLLSYHSVRWEMFVGIVRAIVVALCGMTELGKGYGSCLKLSHGNM